MTTKDDCGKRALAQSRGCRVHQCGHGTVHVTVGRLTLRLAPDQLEDLAKTLGVAAARLREADGTEPARLLC